MPITRQELYTAPTAQGFANTKFPIIYRPTIVVNGVLVPDANTRNYNQVPFGDSSSWYWYGPPADADPNDFSWAKAQVVKGSGVVSSGAAITIIYFSSDASAVSSTDVLTETCGSGLYEAVEEVNDITTLAELEQLSAGLLARSGTVPKLIEFQTDRPGLAPGMILTLNLPSLGPEYEGLQVLITSISSAEQDGPLKFGSVFRHTVRCSTTKDMGDWVKWFERMISRTKKPKPQTQMEKATFIPAIGGPVVAGESLTNSYQVKATGQCFDFTLQADVPTTSERLIMDLICHPVDGSDSFSIFPIRKPRLEAGIGDLQTFTEFAQTPLVLTAGSLISCNVTYETVGILPSPAERVTAVLRISS